MSEIQKENLLSLNNLDHKPGRLCHFFHDFLFCYIKTKYQVAIKYHGTATKITEKLF